jgi:hypothetical protein
MNNTDVIIIKNNLKRPAWLIIPRNVEKFDWVGTSWNQYLVPDYICFISIKKCAYIHDKMYEAGYPKELCDEVFHYNMNKLIELKCSLMLKPSAYATAGLYYLAVKNFGQSAYENCNNEKT